MLPTCVNDVVFTNTADKRHLSRIVDGEVRFPTHSKSAFLLYGRYGTGKTTLAHLLATLLEYRFADDAGKAAYDWQYTYRSTNVSVTPQNAGKQPVSPASFTLVNCGKYHSNSSTTVVQQIDNISRQSLNIGCVAGVFNHFVLDELDCWSDSAQANLKGLITDSPSWNVFYVTTNKKHKIDEGILSRSIAIEMNGGGMDDYLPLVKQHYEHVAGYDDAVILQVIEAARGDWRELENAFCRLS